MPFLSTLFSRFLTDDFQGVYERDPSLLGGFVPRILFYVVGPR